MSNLQKYLEILKDEDRFGIIVTPADLQEFARTILKEAAENAPATAPAEDESLMTTKEVMKFLNISRVCLWHWEKKNIIAPTIRIGGVKRYHKEDIMAIGKKRPFLSL